MRYKVEVQYDLRGQTVTEVLFGDKAIINTFRDNASNRCTVSIALINRKTEEGEPIESVTYGNVYRVSRHPQ